jgi:hypothetical protein
MSNCLRTGYASSVTRNADARCAILDKEMGCGCAAVGATPRNAAFLYDNAEMLP